MGRQVKYMGSADVRRLEKGEDFGGRLAEGIFSDIEWTRDNRFIIDTDEAGLSEEAVTLLLKEPDFRDITDLKRRPLSENERLFGGFNDADGSEAEYAESLKGDDDEGVKTSPGATTPGATTTTTGGSTRGGTRGTAGGSTAGATG